MEEAGEWSLILGDQTELDDAVEANEVMYVGNRLPPQVYQDEYAMALDEWQNGEDAWWNSQDGSGLPQWDDAAWWHWDEYEDLLTPEEHKEVDEAYALALSKVRNFVQARQAVKARNLSRGFYPFAPQGKAVGRTR